MTSIAISYQSEYRFPFFRLILFIVVLAIVIQLTFHGLLRHGVETELVDQACQKHSLGLWKNTDKFYQICQLDDGSYGIRVLVQNIDGTFRKVTGFIRKTSGKPVKELEKVISYVQDTYQAVPWNP